MDLEAREKACLDLLAKLPKEDFVLIGGYASSSFDFPRFSVDLDIVIQEDSLNDFIEILETAGFKPLTGPVPHVEDVYGGNFKRFEHEKIKASVDVLINSVIARQTDYSYSFQYLKMNSEDRDVIGFSVQTKVNTLVANREMLIALKTNSMRRSDIRDVVALCNGNIDTDIVFNHLKNCPREKILSNIQMLLQTIRSERFKDSIKGVFMLQDRVYERLIVRASSFVEQLIERFGQA